MAVPQITATLALTTIPAGGSTTLSVVATDPDMVTHIFTGDVVDAEGHVQHVTVTSEADETLTVTAESDQPEQVTVAGSGAAGVYTVTSIGDVDAEVTITATVIDSTGNTAAATVVLVVDAPDGSDVTDLPPDSVTIGTRTRALDGVDTYRDNNFLVVFSPSTGQTVTPTNKYGVEVTVIGGVVTAINDRVSNDDATGTAIPADGYVVSGHAAVVASPAVSAADWLRQVQVGQAVVLTKAGQVTTWPGEGSGDSDPEDPPSGYGGLPAGPVASMWWFSWEGAKPSSWPAFVRSTVNLIVIGVADSAASGTGSISFGGAGMTKAEVDAITASGTPVVLGIGGSSNNGRIKLLNDTHVDEMFSSISAIRSNLGITGVDYDTENESDWSPTYMAKLSARLKDAFGENFVVGLTMGLYGSLGEQWLQAAQAHNGRYDYAASMLYDFEQAADSRLNGVTTDKIDYMAGGGIPRSKMIMGYALRVTGESYPNSSPPSVALAAIQYAWSARPGIRGAFIWESAREQRNDPPWPGTTGVLSWVRSQG